MKESDWPDNPVSILQSDPGRWVTPSF